MPKMNIEKSIEINASVDNIYQIVSDLGHWTTWSPWLIMEPDAQVIIKDEGKYYEWEGKKVGSGNMKITNEKENESIDIDLTFLKPWKSQSKVRFEFKANGNTTKVTWFMFGSLPFFLFFMKKMMVAFLGSDFKRGLEMLKDYAEDGQVHSKLDFAGRQQFKGTKYVGIETNTSMDKMDSSMKADFDKLGQFASENEGLVSGKPLSIYRKWDMVGGKVEYTACIPVSQFPENLNGLSQGEIPATDINVIKHIGQYRHLGNAWGAQQNEMRNKLFKTNKKIYPFEIYVSDPANTPANDLITEICFAVK